MSDFYGAEHRRFQDEDGTRVLADRLEAMAQAEFDDETRAFVAAQTLFFLSSVDHHGRPTVSYKGGAPGFLRIDDAGALSFPDYDGNGMCLSLGNIAGNPEVGLLFIDFQTPRRLRVQGLATVSDAAEDRAQWPGAQRAVKVTPRSIFVNCGRYIHKAEGGLSLSRHVPDAAGRQPFPAWKRIDAFADVISAEDGSKVAAAGGPVAFEDYRGEA